MRCKDAHRFFEESLALSHPDTAIVTGAFSYTGRYVARRLLDEGVSVRTLTRNPDREGPFGDLNSSQGEMYISLDRTVGAYPVGA